MGFTEAIASCFGKYATFSGRAARSEYWWFMLFLVLGNVVCGFIDGFIFGAGPDGVGILSALFGLGTLLPAVSVAVRRLHDIGRTGWWWWIYIVPLIGWIVMLVFACTRSEAGGNKYGPNPLTGDSDVADVFA